MATTVDYLNKLVTQKNTLADNLVTKGVDATHDETLETLVPKVLNITIGSSKSEYISDGLIKSIVLNEIGIESKSNMLISNMSDIIVSEEMTVECCFIYTDFGSTSNKGRIFVTNVSNILIGMSMNNNILEAAMDASSLSNWAIDGETGITVEAGEFVTLSMTSNSNGTQFYKNGVLGGNYSNNIAYKAGSIIDSICIKYDKNRSERNLIGNVYMLRFYNRILSTDELYANSQTDIQNYNV